MNDEIRMTNDDLKEGHGFFGTTKFHRYVPSRFVNLRYTVAQIEKRLNDIVSVSEIDPPIVATPMRQLARNTVMIRCRNFPFYMSVVTFSSPNGAKHNSPGQRPGSRSHTLLSPVGAAQKENVE